MDAPSYHHRQKVLASTGTFSGYRPLEDLGSHYLDASPAHRQPLCGNAEGWGPLSPFRYDFTPCFIDVWIAIVAVGGVLLGAGTIWWLRKKQEQYKSTQNIHLWIKQASLQPRGALSQILLFRGANSASSHSSRSSPPSSSTSLSSLRSKSEAMVP
jgi:hypothetical protein